MAVNTFKIRQAAVDASKQISGVRVRRNLKLRLIEARRRVLVDRRPLPGCLIIGTIRGGTSSLFKYLDSHRETAASLRKEVRFFTKYWDRGENWYRAHFPITRRRMAFEASPDYLSDPLAPGRAAATVPTAKLIVLMREPITRARSNYQLAARRGLEDRPLPQALAEEPRYLQFGFYAGLLENWLDFYPVESFLLLWSEDFYRDTAGKLNTIAEFLSIAPNGFTAVKRNYSHSGSGGRDRDHRAPHDASLPAWVHERVREENTRLVGLLKSRFPHVGLAPWLQDGPEG